MPIEQFANDATTTLASTLNSGATSISLTNGSAFPTGPHRVRIENEIILIASRSSNTLTVATNGRGSEGTSDVQHASSTAVEHVLTRRGLFNAAGVHDVRAFGAVGNGSTDDSSAIQAALAQCATDGYGTVYIPAGSWNLGTTGITVPGENIWIKGAGVQVTTLLYTGSSGAIRNSDETDNKRYVGISDMTIDASGSSSGASCIRNRNFAYFWVERMRLKNDGASQLAVSCLHIIGGPYGSGYTTYFGFYSNVIAFTRGYGIKIDTGEANVHSFTNWFIGGTYGIAGYHNDTTGAELDSAKHHCTNVAVEGLTSGTAFHLGGNGSTGTRNSTFIDCSVESCTNGIVIEDGSYMNEFLGWTQDGSTAMPSVHSNVTRFNVIETHEASDAVAEWLPMTRNYGSLRPSYLRVPAGSGGYGLYYSVSDPGQIYYDTATNQLMVYNGTNWDYWTRTGTKS